METQVGEKATAPEERLWEEYKLHIELYEQTLLQRSALGPSFRRACASADGDLTSSSLDSLCCLETCGNPPGCLPVHQARKEKWYSTFEIYKGWSACE